MRDGRLIMCDECPCSGGCWFRFKSKYDGKCKDGDWECVWSQPKLLDAEYKCASSNPWPEIPVIGRWYRYSKKVSYFIIHGPFACANDDGKCLEILANSMSVATGEAIPDGAVTIEAPPAPTGLNNSATVVNYCDFDLAPEITQKTFSAGAITYVYDSISYHRDVKGQLVAASGLYDDAWNKWKFSAIGHPDVKLEMTITGSSGFFKKTVKTESLSAVTELQDGRTHWELAEMLMPGWKAEVTASLSASAATARQAEYEALFITAARAFDGADIVVSNGKVNLSATIARWRMAGRDIGALADFRLPSPGLDTMSGDCLMAGYAILESHCALIKDEGSECDKKQAMQDNCATMSSYPKVIRTFYAPPESSNDKDIPLNTWRVRDDDEWRAVDSERDKCALMVIRLSAQKNFPQWYYSVNGHSVKDTITPADLETPSDCMPKPVDENKRKCQVVPIQYTDGDGTVHTFPNQCPATPAFDCKSLQYQGKSILFFSALTFGTPRVGTSYHQRNNWWTYYGDAKMSTDSAISATVSKIKFGDGNEYTSAGPMPTEYGTGGTIGRFSSASKECDHEAEDNYREGGTDISDIIDAYKSARDALAVCASKCSSTWDASWSARGVINEKYKMYSQSYSGCWDGRELPTPTWEVSQQYWTDEQTKIVHSASQGYWYGCENLSKDAYAAALSPVIGVLNGYDKTGLQRPAYILYTWLPNEKGDDGKYVIYYDFHNFPSEKEYPFDYNKLTDPAWSFYNNTGHSASELRFVPGRHPDAFSTRSCNDAASSIASHFKAC